MQNYDWSLLNEDKFTTYCDKYYTTWESSIIRHQKTSVDTYPFLILHLEAFKFKNICKGFVQHVENYNLLLSYYVS